MGGGAIRSRTGLDGFAIRCITALLSRRWPHSRPKRREAEASLVFEIWSGIRGSNSRPIPWQGIALPTELIPHGLSHAARHVLIACHFDRVEPCIICRDFDPLQA